MNINENIVSYLKYLYDISEEEQKKFLIKLKKVSEIDKQKILVSLSKDYKKVKKVKNNLLLGLKQAYNKANEKIEYMKDNFNF